MNPSSGPYFLDPEADPMQESRDLRSLGRLVRVTLPGGVAAWAATDLSTSQALLGHPHTTKDPAHWPALQDGTVPDNWELIALVRGASMLHQGGEDHRRLRRLVNGAFTRAPIEAMRPRITQITQELLAEMAAADGPVDLREAFAYPLPVRVICEVLGVPHTAVSELRERFDRLVIPQESADPETDIKIAIGSIYETLGRLIDLKRNAPGDDLTTALTQAHDDGDRLSRQELVETLFLIMIGGHETTINAITNTAHALLTHPSQLEAALRGGAEVWDRVVDEGLRFTPPIRHVVLRYATQDIDCAGVRISKGEAVLAATVAVGRDPERHEAPEEFDIDRSTSADHLAFGYGAHYCLGARLARLETEIALRHLFTAFPHMRLAEEPAQLCSISLQGHAGLSVHLAGRPGGVDAKAPADRASAGA